MKAKIYDYHTDISLSAEEVKECCKPGEGANTCVWLVVGASGFECTYHNRPHALLDRWLAGKTNAKRNGCDKVKNFTPGVAVEDYYSGIEVDIP